jgi:hypothetical protein
LSRRRSRPTELRSRGSSTGDTIVVAVRGRAVEVVPVVVIVSKVTGKRGRGMSLRKMMTRNTQKGRGRVARGKLRMGGCPRGDILDF